MQSEWERVSESRGQIRERGRRNKTMERETQTERHRQAETDRHRQRDIRIMVEGMRWSVKHRKRQGEKKGEEVEP